MFLLVDRNRKRATQERAWAKKIPGIAFKAARNWENSNSCKIIEHILKHLRRKDF
jgi:hypothetical protein